MANHNHRSSSIEPPLRTCTPLSEAGESTYEMGEQQASFIHSSNGMPGAAIAGAGGMGLGAAHQYQQQVAAILQHRQASPLAGVALASAGVGATSRPPISKAEHDAIFGRAASASSNMSATGVVAHQDDSLQYFEQQQRQQQQLATFQQYQSVAAAHQHQQAMALAANNGPPSRLMPVVEVPSGAQSQLNHDNVAAMQQQQQIAQAMIANGRSPRLMSQQAPPSQVVHPSNASASSVSEITSNINQGGGGVSTNNPQSSEQQGSTGAPTALMIMRRRRSNSLSDQNSGSNSSSRANKNNVGGGGDELNHSGSASSKASSMKSPKHKPMSGAAPVHQHPQGVVDPNDPLNYNASIQQQQARVQAQHQAQQQQAQAYGQPQPQQQGTNIPTLNPHQMLTAMRYNSSLHSTLSGYPMGTPTQLSHPSVTLELIARDRARWEADYYNSSYGLDYGYDNGGGASGAMGGSYYGATPSFRGMSMGLGGSQQSRGMQDSYQPRGGPQLQQALAQQQVQQQQAQQQAQAQALAQQQAQQQAQAQAQASQLQGRVGDLEQRAHELTLNGAPSSSPAPAPATNMPSEVNLTPNSRTRVFQERDYKNDRVWQEDDHSSTSKVAGASSATRRHTDKTSNVTTDSEKTSHQASAAPLPNMPQLRGSGVLGGNATSVQANALPQCQANGQMMGQMPQQVPRHSFIDQYDVLSQHSGMGVGVPYLQSAPPTTPARPGDQDQRVRQLSDLSIMSGMGGHPMFVPPHHPYHYGLMHPPTPGSMGSMPPQFAGVYQQQQQHQDPRHGGLGGGGMHWVDPRLQPPNNHVLQPSSDVVKDATAKSPSKAAGSGIAASAQNDNVQPNAGAPAPAPTAGAPPQHPDTLSPPQPKSKRVSFSHLHIRTYETILGDNPSCSGGPSLGLGWRYDPNYFTASVDDWEAHQAQVYGVTAKGEPLTIPPEDLVLHRFEREAILLNTGYTRQDLADSVRAVNKVKNKRRQTVHNLPVAFVEERVEAVKRTARRWMWKKERTRHMYDDWKKKSSEGNNQEKKRK